MSLLKGEAADLHTLSKLFWNFVLLAFSMALDDIKRGKNWQCFGGYITHQEQPHFLCL